MNGQVSALTRSLRQRARHASLARQHLPQLDLWLYLVAPEFNRQSLTQDEVNLLMETPPYWCLVWPGGWLTGDWLRRHPGLVQGRSVLDFGCGSGVAGLCAAGAGARVTLLDECPEARQAASLNSAANHLPVQWLQSDDFNAGGQCFDVILLADVLYDHKNLPLLHSLRQRASLLLIAESRGQPRLPDGCVLLDQVEMDCIPAMDDVRQVRLYRLHGSGAGVETAPVRHPSLASLPPKNFEHL